MVRAPCFDRYGMKKGAWSEEEDNKLRAFVLTHGHWNWRLLPKYAGLARCGKSCRLRWVNYLKPGVKRGNYTKQEEELIIELHAQFGTKWSIIAKYLPGRTDNDIKNFWNAHVEKRRKRVNPDAKSEAYDDVPKEESLSSTSLIEPAILPFDAQAEVNLWADHHMFLGDAGNYNDQKDWLPPMIDHRYMELSCSESTSGFEWIANDDNIMSWEYVDQPMQSPLPPLLIQEEGGFYGHSFDQCFSYGMHFLS